MEKPLHSLLSLTDSFPKCSSVRQLAEPPHLSGYQQHEVLLFHISHKEQLLPHSSQGQRRQHRPHRGNKVPVRQLRARTCSQAVGAIRHAEALQQNKVVTHNQKSKLLHKVTTASGRTAHDGLLVESVTRTGSTGPQAVP